MNQQESFNSEINNINNNNIINEVKLKKYPLKIGLENLGHTSYLNASLLCLFNIDKLSEYFQNKYTNLNKKLACAYTDLLFELKNTTSKCINPSNFKSIIGELNSLFKGNETLDARELIFFIIERLHQELKPPSTKLNIQIDFYQQELISLDDKLSLQNFINYLKLNQSFIFDTFYGITKIERKWNKCNIIKYSYQTFNMLNFKLKEAKDNKIKNIGNENYQGIDIFDAFENIKKLNTLDMIYYNNCKR